MQFISLIGGRVCNPRQQHVVDIQSILLLPRVTNPPPQIRQSKTCPKACSIRDKGHQLK